MLRNPAYYGVACFGKTEQTERQRTTRPLRQRGGYSPRSSANREKPREQWIGIPVPPLVSEETYALAQEQLEKNKRHATRRTKEPTLLQSMLVCKQCGYAYYRSSTRTSKRKLYYYRCLGSDNYRHLGGRVCENRPIRQDYLDVLVWKEIIRLLQEPALVGAEIDRRIQARQTAKPTVRRKETLRKEQTRVQKNISQLLDAYQEELLPLEELRPRMVALRKRQQTALAELNSLESQTMENEHYLRLAESMTDFLSQLQISADTLDIIERQKILRLIVKEILVDDDTITIRHSIPTTSGASIIGHSGNGKTPGYLLRSGSHDSPLRRTFVGLSERSLFEIARL